MAQFRRQLKTTHPTLGSSIIDTPISHWYSDVFDGQVTQFPHMKGLATGIIPIGSDPANCSLLLEFPNILKPTYGEATLTGLDLFLYTDNIDMDFDFSIPTLEIYKLKQELPTIGTWDTSEAKIKKLHFGGTSYDNLPRIVESFTGVSGTGAGIAMGGKGGAYTKWYCDPKEFWDTAAAGGGPDFGGGITRGASYSSGSYTTFRNQFASQVNGEWRMYFKLAGTGTMDHWKPSKGIKWYAADPQFARYVYDSHWNEYQGYGEEFFSGTQLVKYEADPKFTGDANEESFLAAARANTAHSDDTIFTLISYTPEKTNGINDAGQPNVECFSTPYFSSRSGSTTLRLYSFIATNTEIEQSYTFGNMETPTALQTIALHGNIPKPLPWVRKFRATSEDAMNSVHVDFKFKINAMSKHYRYKDNTTKATGQSLSRSLSFVFSNVPIKSNANLADFVSRVTDTPSRTINADPWNDKTMSEKHIQYTIVSFIAVGKGWDGDLPEGTKSNDGIIKIVMSNTNSDHKAGIDSLYDDSDGYVVTAPYVQKQKHWTGAGTGGQIANDLIHNIGSLTDDEDSGNLGGSGMGDWVTLKACINYLNSDMTFFLLDKKGDTMWSNTCKMSPPNARAVASGADSTNTAGDFDRSFEEAGYPGHFSIWTHNQQIKSDSEAYYSHNMTDAVVDVDIGSINIYGHEPSLLNATGGDMKDNQVKSPVVITSQSNMSNTLINTEDGNIASLYGVEPPVHPHPTNEKSTISPLPTYISWGLGGDSNPWTGDDLNIFLGGYHNSNPTYSDATDSAKRIKYATGASQRGGSNTSITFFHPKNTSTCKLGAWFCLNDSNVNADGTEVGHFNNNVTVVGDNHIDQFTKKGFIQIASSTKPIPKSENPAFSTKITEFDSRKGEITVADASKLSGFRDDEFIIYRANYPRDARYYKTGLKLKNQIDFSRGNLKLVSDSSSNADLNLSDLQDPEATIAGISSTTDTGCTYTIASGDPFKVGDYLQVGNEIMRVKTITVSTNTLVVKRGQFNTTKFNHADGAAIYIRGLLCNNACIEDLYISPYKYWIAAEIYNVDEDNEEPLPTINYSHSLVTNDTITPASLTAGATMNERVYSDTISYSNAWTMSSSDPTSIKEYEVDYGYGVYDENIEQSKGYINKFTPKSGVFNSISLDGLVKAESSRLERETEKISLVVETGDVSIGTAALHTTKSSQDPYLEFIFTDEKPKLESFKVQPYETDPMYPEYMWECGDDDLFYGFMMISNEIISSKYHSAVLHLPMNDLTTTVKAYKYDGNNSKELITASEVTSTSLVISREGLAGNCFTFDGTARMIIVDDGDYSQPTDAMSLVAHFTCGSITAPRYICSEYGSYRMWIDTSGNINAAATPTSGTEVVLKSSTVIVTDDETPYCAILTFDTSLGQGNLKLFINGKLEDQSGIKTTSGSINNWKINTNLADGSKDFYVGAYDSDGNGTHDSGTYHNGKIEEVILYNTTIYPVVPQTGKEVIIKPMQELTISNIASGISNVARLFIMDFHNIRGMTSSEVTSSSNIAFRKSGLGLKTN